MGTPFVLLEENKEQLGLEFYSVSVSTLAEVFFKVVRRHGVSEEDRPSAARCSFQTLVSTSGWLGDGGGVDGILNLNFPSHASRSVSAPGKRSSIQAFALFIS